VQQKQLRLSRAALRPQMLAQDVQHRRARLAALAPQLPRGLLALTAQKRLHLGRYSLRSLPLSREIAHKRQGLAAIEARMARAGQQQLGQWRQRLAGLERTRQSLNYKNTLKRGFAIVRGDGVVATSVKAAKKAALIELEFADGRLKLGAGKPKPAPKKPAPDQGSLF